MAVDKWTEEITPEKGWFTLNLAELWRYRDLILLFIKRDFIAIYKQTILGPLWYVIQPILTSITYYFTFGVVAKLDTGGAPAFIFYMCGITAWSYFSQCLLKTSTIFTSNASIFGKVYFPRLVVPISIVASNLVGLLIQLVLLFIVLTYYVVVDGTIAFSANLLLLPIFIVVLGLLGLGGGLIISALTTKYRDFQFFLTFGVQLLMFTTPVIYPMSLAASKLGNKSWILGINPLSPLIEGFRYAFIGAGGELNMVHVAYSFIFSLFLVGVGMLVFNRTENSFMDTV
jgi:lipopolysaccharide transport system permease protein